MSFGGSFEVTRGHIILGSSHDVLLTLLSDPSVKEFQIFLDLNNFPNIFSLGASLVDIMIVNTI